MSPDAPLLPLPMEAPVPVQVPVQVPAQVPVLVAAAVAAAVAEAAVVVLTAPALAAVLTSPAPVAVLTAPTLVAVLTAAVAAAPAAFAAPDGLGKRLAGSDCTVLRPSNHARSTSARIAHAHAAVARGRHWNEQILILSAGHAAAALGRVMCSPPEPALVASPCTRDERRVRRKVVRE